MPTNLGRILGPIAAAAALVPFTASSQTVALRGPAGESRTLTAADLAGLPHDQVVLPSEHGPARTYAGVPLTLLLQSVGAPAGKMLRGPAMADVVVVAASDGYRVALALAETDPGVRAQKILLADTADGAPLGADDGPFRLVVGGDLRAARSARMVTSITVETAP
jgi:hypothetical protein